MPKRLLRLLLAAFLLGLTRPAVSQAPATQKPPGPGDPLPELSMKFQRGSLETLITPEGIKSIGTNMDVLWGDVRLVADRVEYDARAGRLVATGNVVLTRGDETLRGSSFTFDADTGVGIAENAVAVSPPFYVSGARIERTATGLFARNALFTPCPEGKGELRITAREIEVVNDRYLIVRRAALHLFGARLLTVPRYRIPLGRDREDAGFDMTLPLHVRASRVSGLVVGATVPFTPVRGLTGSATLEVPTRRSLQYRVSLERDFLGASSPIRQRGDLPTPGGVGTGVTGESPLRTFLRARPLPPPSDPILDFEDILTTDDRLSFPTRLPRRFLRAGVTAAWNQDISGKRRAESLLSRVPELRITGGLPVTSPVPTANPEARNYLRRPRPLLTGGLAVGRYEERVLAPAEAEVTRSRVAATAGVGTLPLLVGSRLLVRPEFTLTYQDYGRGDSYRVAETNLAANYVFGTRTFVGANYIRRFTQGATPFIFDVVDTASEAQARGQIATRGGRYTLAGLVRYDVNRREFFDFEVAVAARGRCIESRLTYRKLGQQIGVNLVFPGLTR